jgi:hypothetical protein
MDCSYINGIKNTMVRPEDSVERLNYLLRVAIVVGAAFALFTYLSGDFESLKIVGIASASVIGLSLLLNTHTAYKTKEGTLRFFKETAKTLFSPIYLPAALYEAPFIGTYVYQGQNSEYKRPVDGFERANTFLRLFATVGAGLVIYSLIAHNATLFQPALYSTIALASVSGLCNLRTTYDSWMESRDTYTTGSVLIKEMGKTVFAPLFITRTLLDGFFIKEREVSHSSAYITGIENTMYEKESKREWLNFLLRLTLVAAAAIAVLGHTHVSLEHFQHTSIVVLGSVAGASFFLNFFAAYDEGRRNDKSIGDGVKRYIKEGAKTIFAPVYLPAMMLSAPFETTLHDTQSVVEWTNVFVRMALVGAAGFLLWTYLAHQTTLFYPALYATGGAFALSCILNAHTGYKQGGKAWLQEMAKTTFSPLFVPTMFLHALFRDPTPRTT